MFLRYSKEVGDFGEFQLVIHNPGVWEVSLAHAKANGNGELRVTIGDQSHTIQPTGTLTMVGEFELPDTGEELTLRIEAIRKGSPQGPILSRLGNISLNLVQ